MVRGNGMDKRKYVIDTIIAKMSSSLNNEQLTLLEATLIVSLKDMKVEEECTSVTVTPLDWDYYLKLFRATKRLNNCSELTLKQYDYAINKFRMYCNKNPRDVNTVDIKYFLAMCGSNKSILTKKEPSKTYINNLKNCLSSFFKWMFDDGYINRNPVSTISSIKIPKTIKKAYSGEDMEKLKASTKSARDMAIIHFLDSTGLRVSEAISVNKKDINWDTRTLVVYGSKGKAERFVMFTEECSYWLKEYLKSRSDDNEALFVIKKKPHTRITKSGMEHIVRCIGDNCGVHAYPHRSRRTLITKLDRRGMSLQNIQAIAGHKNSQTTQIYIDKSNAALKADYDKYN